MKVADNKQNVLLITNVYNQSLKSPIGKWFYLFQPILITILITKVMGLFSHIVYSKFLKHVKDLIL